MYAKKGANIKVAATLLAIVLLISCGIGGTIAWLKADPTTIVNTFTTSDLSITLSETEPAGKTAQMIPGATIAKNPKITVSDDSVDCYVFVKIEESANFSDFMTYSVASGWNGELGDGVYWREVTANTSREFDILADNCVVVSGEVDKADMAAAKNSNPTLRFTAYAIQSANLKNASNETPSISEIWQMAQANATT